MMAPELPKQESEAGTYMEIPVIRFIVVDRLVNLNGQPGNTNTIWLSILSRCFDVHDGYSPGPGYAFEAGRGHSFAYYLVKNCFSPPENRFLLVECSTPGNEAEPGIWSDAADKLKEHLSGVVPSERIYSAIAIGRIVRFYEWEDGSLRDFQNDNTGYYIDLQCQSITQRLNCIRGH